MKSLCFPAALVTMLLLTFAGCPSSGGNADPPPGNDAKPNVDTTAPAVSIDSLATNQRRPQLTGTVDDAAATVTVNAGTMDLGAAVNDGQGRWTLSCPLDVPDGTYALLAKARDQAGNVAQATGQLVVDATAPRVAVESLTTNDTSPQLSGTVDDPAATVSVTLAGRTYPATNNAGGTWTLAKDTINPPLPAGTYDVTLEAADALGNLAQAVAKAALVIDTTPPGLTAEPLTTNRRRPQLAGTIDDPTATVTAAIGPVALGTAVHSGSGAWTLASTVDVPDGTHTVTVTARDPAGNTAQTTLSLVLDATAPRVTVDSLATADTTPPLSGTIDDPAASIQVMVAGQPYAPALNGKAWTIADDVIAPPLAPGWYDIAVTATDTFGNVGTDTTTRELRVTAAPAIERAILADDNLSMLITFDQPVYTDAAHSVPISLGNLQLVYIRGPDTVASMDMVGLSNADGGPLLGASRVRVAFSLVGGPTLGLSYVGIYIPANTIWNAQGQVAADLGTGHLALHDPRNLLNGYDWGFEKFLDASPNDSWSVVNAVGTTSLLHSGMRSALLADPTPAYGERSITVPNNHNAFQLIAVTPATDYTISAWVYVRPNTVGAPADTGIRLRLLTGRTGAPPQLDGAILTVPVMNTWQQLACTVQTPADSNGHAWVVVQAADINPNDSDVYVDDLRMTLGTTP